MNKYLKISVLFFPLFFSCDSSYSILYLYSKDKDQVITVFTNKSFSRRIIANGKHKNIPDNNYILLDITNIDRIGDEIGVCWKSAKYKWEVVNHQSEILESKIDTTKFIMRTEWFRDERLLPNAGYYRQDNCFTVGTSKYDKIYPQENGFVERID